MQSEFYEIEFRPHPLTRRIVAARVVSESPLPYGIREINTPELSHEFWNSIVTREPDFDHEKECVVVVSLDTRLRPINWNIVSIGTVNESSAHPREVLRPIIASGAYGFLVMHNHPSGDPSPSRADESITRRISEGATLLQIRLVDHIIIGTTAPGRSPYYSFRESGIIS